MGGLQHPPKSTQRWVLTALPPSIPEGLWEHAGSGMGRGKTPSASLPSVSGGAGRGLEAPTSPPWLTLRSSVAGAFLPGRGRLLLQPSRLPGSGNPLGSVRMKEHRGWSEVVPSGSAVSCLPRAFQAGRGSMAAAGLRKGASAGNAGQSCGCPAAVTPGDGGFWCWDPACSRPRGWVSIRHRQRWAPMGARDPARAHQSPLALSHVVLLGASRGDRALRHPPVTHLWTPSACGPSGRGESPQSCPRCPLQAQATNQRQRAGGPPSATSTQQGRGHGGSPCPLHGCPARWGSGWGGRSPSPSEPAFLISLSLLCKGEESW